MSTEQLTGVVLRSGGNLVNSYSKQAVIDAAKQNGWEIRKCADGEVEAIGSVVIHHERQINGKNDR